LGLCVCSLHKNSEFSKVYKVELDPDHPLTVWLIDQCEGPWAVGLWRPYFGRKPFVAFARVADAMLFCLKA
jgi:hypothetical protein